MDKRHSYLNSETSIHSTTIRSSNFKSLVVKGLVIAISSVAILSGCQATSNFFGKFDNGSLKYQEAEKLEPLELPAEQETAPFTPLYPTPAVGVNTLDLENDSGNRYELPPPYRQVPAN